MSSQIEILNKTIGKNSLTFVIAEIGINHNGNLREAIQLISAAKEAGADAVKFQSYTTDKRVKKDSPLFDILMKCELSHENQKELFDVAKHIGIIPFSTPFDEESIDFLESINCPAYKVASFDTVNKQLLRKLRGTNKPIIMSTGMTSIDELGEAWIELGGKKDGSGCKLALLHCISSYPTPIDEANLAMISLLKNLHGGPVGYSDHTIGVEIPIMAVISGAQIIEKHFTLDKSLSGPDHAMSADPETLKEMIQGIRRAEIILGAAEMRSREIEASSVIYRRPTS